MVDPPDSAVDFLGFGGSSGDQLQGNRSRPESDAGSRAYTQKTRFDEFLQNLKSLILLASYFWPCVNLKGVEFCEISCEKAQIAAHTNTFIQN